MDDHQVLSHDDISTFSVVADTLLPAIDGNSPAWHQPIPAAVIAAQLPLLFSLLPHDDLRADLKRLLALLRSPAGGMVLYRRPRPFQSLPPAARGEAYRTMEASPLGLVRAGARALKTLVAVMWVTPGPSGQHPAPWAAMGYPGPGGLPPPAPKNIPIVAVDGDLTVVADVVVVGSGAGGGPAAAILARTGLDVVVLETGRYRNQSDFTHFEAEAYRDMYLQGGLGSTADSGITILSGATLGGGTVINYTTSFPTPMTVREEWDRVGGFSEVFGGADFQAASDAVCERLAVNWDHGWPSNREQLLEKGLRELGWHVDEQPRNARGCSVHDCGFCTMGCRLDSKQSMLATYLEDAAAAGGRIVPGATVHAVTTDQGRATGVVGTVDGYEIRVRARAVVLAAGALNTPAILLRSGLGGPAVGRFLRLHPVTVVWGRFQDRVEPWTGIMQARYSDQFADLDGRGYGFKFETAPIHPLFPAAFIGWEDGLSYKRDVLGLGNIGPAGILLRDRDHGRVKIRRDGSPIWDYAISRYDQRHIREGVLRGAQLMEAAGAVEVISSTVRPVRWRPGQGGIHEFIAQVDRVGYGSNRMGYFSFHQMGSARMGSDPTTSVVDANNESHSVAGLYVMDGSCFPTASGANPMISIAAIAHRGATVLAGRLV